jgi:hypothetical protein
VGGKSATPEPVTDTDAKKEPWRLSTELYKASDKADKYIAGNSVLGSTWLIGDIARSVTSWPLATMGLVTETSEKAAPSMMGHYAVPFDLANGNYAAAGAKEAAATKGMSRANYDAASIMAIGAVTSFKEDPARAAYDFIGIPLLMGGAGKLASGVTGVRTGPSIKALATDKTTGTPLSGVGFDLQKAAPTVSELLADRSSKPPTIAPVTDTPSQPRPLKASRA